MKEETEGTAFPMKNSALPHNIEILKSSLHPSFSFSIQKFRLRLLIYRALLASFILSFFVVAGRG